MGIQSTRTITRQQAVERIRHIQLLVALGNYRAIELETYEDSGRDLKAFVDSEQQPTQDPELWTNDMLAAQMDQPYYRLSYFDNYIVEDAPGDQD